VDAGWFSGANPVELSAPATHAKAAQEKGEAIGAGIPLARIRGRTLEITTGEQGDVSVPRPKGKHQLGRQPA